MSSTVIIVISVVGVVVLGMCIVGGVTVAATRTPTTGDLKNKQNQTGLVGLMLKSTTHQPNKVYPEGEQATVVEPAARGSQFAVGQAVRPEAEEMTWKEAQTTPARVSIDKLDLPGSKPVTPDVSPRGRLAREFVQNGGRMPSKGSNAGAPEAAWTTTQTVPPNSGRMGSKTGAQEAAWAAAQSVPQPGRNASRSPRPSPRRYGDDGRPNDGKLGTAGGAFWDRPSSAGKIERGRAQRGSDLAIPQQRPRSNSLQPDGHNAPPSARSNGSRANSAVQQGAREDKRQSDPCVGKMGAQLRSSLTVPGGNLEVHRSPRQPSRSPRGSVDAAAQGKRPSDPSVVAMQPRRSPRQASPRP